MRITRILLVMLLLVFTITSVNAMSIPGAGKNATVLVHFNNSPNWTESYPRDQIQNIEVLYRNNVRVNESSPGTTWNTSVYFGLHPSDSIQIGRNISGDGSDFMLGSTTNMTQIEMWYKPDNYLLDNYVVSMGSSPTTDGWYWFIGSGGQQAFRIYGGGGLQYSLTAAAGNNTYLADNNWHHIALTKKGRNVRLFSDGYLVADGTTTYVSTATGNLTLGKNPNTGASQPISVDDLLYMRNVSYTNDFLVPSSEYQYPPPYIDANANIQLDTKTITITAGNPKNVTLSVSNLTGNGADYISAFVHYNISNVKNTNIFLNTTVTRNWSMITLTNTTAGYIQLNLSAVNKTSYPSGVAGSTLVPIVDLLFDINSTSCSNSTEPLSINTIPPAYVKNTTLLSYLFGIKRGNTINIVNPIYTINWNVFDSGSGGLVSTQSIIDQYRLPEATYIGCATMSTGMGSSSLYAGDYRFVVSASGYYSYLDTSRTISADETISYSLAAVGSTGYTTWYSPKQIGISVQRYETSNRVTNASITLNAIGNTLQSDSQLQTLYGINPAVANQMLNGTLIMNGTTGSDGSVAFTILSSIKYRANVTDPIDGVVYSAYLNPMQDPYTIWIGHKPTDVNMSVQQSTNTTKLWVSQPNASYITMNMQYQDTSGYTTNVRFIVKAAANMTNVVDQDLGNPGKNMVFGNLTVRNIRGEGWFYYFNATRVTP